MKIIAVEQNTMEWLAARAGVVTASEMDAILTPEFAARRGEGVTTYLAQKVAEKWIGGSLPHFQTLDMEFGKILEEKAIPAYEFQFSEKITRVGLLTTDCGRVGCSPDGLIGDDGGIEIKCPRADTHTRTLLTGSIPKDYLVQIHTALYVTGRPWWKFMSFHRRFPHFVTTVERDEEIQEKIADVLDGFLERYANAMKHMEQLNDGPSPSLKPLTPIPPKPKPPPQPRPDRALHIDEVVP